MKQRFTELLLLTTALMLLVACGGISESDIEATVEARVEIAKTSLVAPTAAPLPTYSPAPAPEVVVKEVSVEVIKEVRVPGD